MFDDERMMDKACEAATMALGEAVRTGEHNLVERLDRAGRAWRAFVEGARVGEGKAEAVRVMSRSETRAFLDEMRGTGESAADG